MAAGDGGGGELFSLVWGLGATGFGWVLVTDFRGAAQRFHRLQTERARLGWPGPRLGVGFVRFVAGVFAVVGPLTLVGAVRGLAQGAEPTLPDTMRLPTPFLAVAALVGAVVLWSMWRRAGFVRRTWDAGGPLLRGAAVVQTLAVGGFLTGMGLGHQATTLGSWLVGAVAGIVMLVGSRARHGSPPGDG